MGTALPSNPWLNPLAPKDDYSHHTVECWETKWPLHSSIYRKSNGQDVEILVFCRVHWALNSGIKGIRYLDTYQHRSSLAEVLIFFVTFFHAGFLQAKTMLKFTLFKLPYIKSFVLLLWSFSYSKSHAKLWQLTKEWLL
jgi:hypothetical protein